MADNKKTKEAVYEDKQNGRTYITRWLDNGFPIKLGYDGHSKQERDKMGDWSIAAVPLGKDEKGNRLFQYQVYRLIDKNNVNGGGNYRSVKGYENRDAARHCANLLMKFERDNGIKVHPDEYREMLGQEKFRLPEDKAITTVGDLIKSKIEESIKNGEQLFWTKDFWGMTAFNFNRPQKPYMPYNMILLSSERTTIYGSASEWKEKGGEIDDNATKDFIISIIPNFRVKRTIRETDSELADRWRKTIEECLSKRDYEPLFAEAEKQDGCIEVRFGQKLHTVYSIDVVKGLKPAFVEKQKAVLREMDNGKKQNADISLSQEQLAERIVDSWIKESGVKLEHKNMSSGEAAHYTPLTHTITMPKKEQFNNASSYYEVIFHEMAHSTMAMLDRADFFKNWKGRSKDEHTERTREELVAEMTACALLNYCNMDNELQNKRNLYYIENWNGKLKDFDGANFIYATSEAQKAYESIVQSYEKRMSHEMSKLPDELANLHPTYHWSDSDEEGYLEFSVDLLDEYFPEIRDEILGNSVLSDGGLVVCIEHSRGNKKCYSILYEACKEKYGIDLTSVNQVVYDNTFGEVFKNKKAQRGI